MIEGRFQLRLQVTSGNVTLTSDPLLTSSDLYNAGSDDARCTHFIDVEVDRNQVTLTGACSHSY